MSRLLLSSLLVSLSLVGCRGTLDDLDGDGADISVDCNDNDATVFPGADEICDGIDNDCDGLIDPNNSTDAQVFYADVDGDNAGNETVSVTACDAPSGFVSSSDDCDDTDPSRYPGATEDDCTDPIDHNCDGSVGYADADADGFAACNDCDDSSKAISPVATEICDGVDNNCDGTTDENAADAPTWYSDTDADGFGDLNAAITACVQPMNDTNKPTAVSDSTDCNDTDNAVHPFATETCNAVDDNCNGLTDEDATDASVWYLDADSDGQGGEATFTSCAAPAGYVATSTDCDDLNPSVYLGATELCDQLDTDCDGQVPAAELEIRFLDADGDGFGTLNVSANACLAPNGYVVDSTDCDDSKATIYPGATELCDQLDTNCNGQVPSDETTRVYIDRDGDGHGSASLSEVQCAAPNTWVQNSDDCDDSKSTVYLGAVELVDGLDNSCDGQIDPLSEVGGMAPSTAMADCSRLLKTRPNLGDGTYWINSAYDDMPYEAYCDMSTDGGGWTLAMKLDGRGPEMNYTSPHWTTPDTFNAWDLTLSRTDAKYQAFNSLPFNAVRVSMETPIASFGVPSFLSVQIPQVSPSLLSLFNQGYTPFSLGRSAWEGLVTGPSLQANCNREGFNNDGNVGGSPQYPGLPAARIGILANEQNDCLTVDSVIGIGIESASGYCNANPLLSAGNNAGCTASNGDVQTAGFAALWVRCEDAADDTFDGVDQNCDGTDGTDADFDGYALPDDCDDSDPTVYPGAGCALPKSCADALAKNPAAPDGVYTIDPGFGDPAFSVYCDMTTDGGGWALIAEIVRNHGAAADEDPNWFSMQTNVSQLLNTVSEEETPSSYASHGAQHILPLLGNGASQTRFTLIAENDVTQRATWFKDTAPDMDLWFSATAHTATPVCTDVSMTQNCSTGDLLSVANDVTFLDGMNLNVFGYTTSGALHLRQNNNFLPSFSSVCSVTFDYDTNAWNDSTNNHWGNGLEIWMR